MNRPAGWLAILALGALGATAQTPGSRPATSWRRVDTPHFTVIGTADREIGDVATQLERFREAVAQLLPSAATATIVPAVVIVFDSSKTFDAFKPIVDGKPRDEDGLVVSSPAIDYIGLVAGSRGFRAVFHQYTHLVAANLRVSLPLWLTEGLAEYYSTFDGRPGGNKVSIGEPITSHLMSMRSDWMKLDELRSLAADSAQYDEDERRSLPYAESWALVHYLLHGTPSYRDHLEKYFSAIESGAGEEEVWSRLFGSPAFETAFRDYVDRAQSRMIGATLTTRVDPVTAPAKSISDQDADALLGDFLARTRRDAGRRPPAPSAAGRPAGDWLADYMFAVAVAETGAAALPEDNPAQLAAAREALQRTLRARPDLAHASHLLAGFALQARDLEAARDASESAAFLAPARVEYSLRLAEVFTRRKEYTKARSVLGPLMTNPRAAEVRDRVKTLLASVAEAERAAAASSETAPAAEAPAPGPMLDLRRLQSGEERSAGMLTRIDCDRKKGVTFHVRVDDRPLEYRAKGFQDVEFVSYRDDMLGEVKCGAREPEDLVYVTWKEAEPPAPGAPAAKTIVAVEFLPKDYKPKN